ncbi:anti-anti sigma factor protein [Sorangium cellulosum]|uniref:Anti-anti sigma factor protein n=1 Tax=Sorangium cellulosum TaxID=56 RepID=A0A4P2Q058_SORCE|nr:PAS domain-containing protein [Sorangium cellulosum]AUX22584.1 anti-anti sigma factor protein [Sorangium cellulosum]
MEPRMQREGADCQTPGDEVTALRARVAELERELAEARAALSAESPVEPASLLDRIGAARSSSVYAALLDAIPAMVFFKDRHHRYLIVNKAYAAHYQLPVEKIIGKRDEDIFVEETARSYHDNDEDIMSTGIPRLNVELQYRREDGTDGWTLENNVPYRDAEGRVVGMAGVVIDMTDRKRAEEALRRAEDDLLATQERLLATIATLSAPVLPIDEGILVLPIVGNISTMRSAQIMEALLHGVERHDADFVIIDLTGVPLIDSAVARHLLRAVQAVSLLGAQCVLAGISAGTAQSLVHTGDALAELIIRRDLRAAVRYAMARRSAMTRRLQTALG